MRAAFFILIAAAFEPLLLALQLSTSAVSGWPDPHYLDQWGDVVRSFAL
jgi:hypothetical protein